MLDKIYYRSNKEVVMIFTNSSPVTIYHSEGKVLELLDEILAPIGSGCETLSEYTQRIISSEEDTVIINLDEVA